MMPQCFIFITHLVPQSQYIIDPNVVQIYQSSSFFFVFWTTGLQKPNKPPPPLDTALTYRLIGPGEPHEDGEMSEMTLPSRHRIRNSSPNGLRASTLPLGHGGSLQY